VTKLVQTKLSANSILAETPYIEIQLKTEIYGASYKP